MSFTRILARGTRILARGTRILARGMAVQSGSKPHTVTPVDPLEVPVRCTRLGMLAWDAVEELEERIDTCRHDAETMIEIVANARIRQVDVTKTPPIYKDYNNLSIFSKAPFKYPPIRLSTLHSILTPISGLLLKAMEAGEFDTVTTSGISLAGYESMDAGVRLLKNAGCAPAWIEQGKELRLVREQLRAMVSTESSQQYAHTHIFLLSLFPNTQISSATSYT